MGALRKLSRSVKRGNRIDCLHVKGTAIGAWQNLVRADAADTLAESRPVARQRRVRCDRCGVVIVQRERLAV